MYKDGDPELIKEQIPLPVSLAPYGVKFDSIRFAVRMRTNDERKTPVIHRLGFGFRRKLNYAENFTLRLKLTESYDGRSRQEQLEELKALSEENLLVPLVIGDTGEELVVAVTDIGYNLLVKETNKSTTPVVTLYCEVE